MSIVLIGMPSCGKSTVGVLLAKALGYKFVDTDLLIQEREGALLCEIIAREGKEGFIRIENEVLMGIKDENAVISTGGSAVYCDGAMESLKRLGKTVYIRISYGEMTKRLGNFSHRGVVIRKGTTLLDLYRERAPLYEKYADVIVDSTRSLKRTLEEILKRI